jgi:tetratricopeptide (TPR) repeat protein
MYSNEYESSKLFFESNQSYREGDFKEAIYLSKKGLSLCDKESKISENLFQLLTFLYIHTNDLNNALIQSNEGLKLFPDSISIKMLQGNIFMKMKHFQTALSIFQSINEKNPNSPTIQYFLGLSNFHLKRWAKSLDHFLESLKLEPTYEPLSTNFYISQCYYSMGDHKNAEKYLNVAKSIDSEFISNILKVNQ